MTVEETIEDYRSSGYWPEPLNYPNHLALEAEVATGMWAAPDEVRRFDRPGEVDFIWDMSSTHPHPTILTVTHDDDRPYLLTRPGSDNREVFHNPADILEQINLTAVW